MRLARSSIVVSICLVAVSCSWKRTDVEAVTDDSIVVYYWPAVDRCAPQDVSVLRAVREFARLSPTVRIVTVLPRGVEITSLYGQPLPAERRRVETYRDLGLLPRIEVWLRDNTKVLERVVGRHGDQYSLVLQELYGAAGILSDLGSVGE